MISCHGNIITSGKQRT